MSFIGTVGVVAQQGNQGAGAGCTAAPTSVSMATTSSGNYDDACIVYSINLGSSGEDGLAANTGSGFSMDSGDSYDEIHFDYSGDYSAMLNNNSGVLKFGVKAYIRETSVGGEVATSWTWALKETDPAYDDTNSSAISATAVGGTASTSQDATSSGVGEYVQITHSSGGRGYLQMFNGDWIQWTVNATAGNACGPTVASPTLRIKIEFS